jgi:hypothetical protein
MDSSEFVQINTIGKDAKFKPGQSYTAEVRVIGSHLSVKYPNSDIEPDEIDIGATRQRFGGIGLALDEECELKLSTFKYKELRSNRRQ